MRLVSLEGNIGSGKSTLLRAIERQSRGRVLVVQEPVDEWRTPIFGDDSVFTMYYNNPQKYAFMFQWFVCVSRMRHLRRCIETYAAQHDGQEPELVIMERCIHADREIFMKHLHRTGAVDEVEMHVYDDIMTFLMSHETMLQPVRNGLHAVIYLRATPERSAERVIARAREAETNAVDVGFLQALHERHDAWLLHKRHPHHVIVIHSETNADNVDEWADQQARDILQQLNA